MNQLIIDKILLINATIALFLSILFLRKKSKARHDYIIGSWLVFLGLYVFLYAFSPQGFFINHSWLVNLYIGLLYLNGPFLFFYVKTITGTGCKIAKTFVWHLLPFVLFTLYSNIFFSGWNILIDTGSIHEISDFELPLPYLLFIILLAVSVPFYILLSVRLLQRHKKVIADNFSDLEKRTLLWLKVLIIILGISWIILASVIFIHHILLLFSDSFCINGLFMTLSVFMVLAGYFGLYQPQVFVFQDKAVPIIIKESEKQYAGSSLKENDRLQYIARLNDYMNNARPFLDNQITLNQLANDVNVPLHHLSRIINEYYNQNFFDFINQFRVNEFIRRLPDRKYSNYSLLAIAFDCGFNSKTTFNRYFKKATGLTPSQYKSKISD